MKSEYSNSQIPLFLSLGFLLIVVLVEFLVILSLNNGMLVYTLDDPYIHLALAQQIMKGHYGINSIEFSAPSSTILWPFIIAPFSSFEYFPFLLNVAASIITVYIFIKILYASFSINDKRIDNILIPSFLILLTLATNIIGLIFTGMEHSMQVLFVSVIAYGLIVEIEKNKVELWFLIAIVAAPLIRYENLAVSIAAFFYLILNGYFKSAVAVALFLIVFVGGFSIFLLLLGLDPLPASVIAKSSVVESGGNLYSILDNVWNSLMQRQGIILSLGILALLSYLLFEPDIKKKKLTIITILAVFIHFIAGRFGRFNRYEIYIWTFFLLILLYLFSSRIKKLLEGKNGNDNLIKVIILAAGIAVVVSTNYIIGLFDLPIAANNIYEQQYQMHRFAVYYYKKPVAVNDLGYVSYKNDNYVLDLFGLASIEAFNDRRTRNSSGWIQKLVSEKNTGLAMIYEKWFKRIPGSWIKIGDLHLGKKQITPAFSKVSFYATGKNYYSEIKEKLRLFIKTLPADVTFSFEGND